MKKCKKCEGCGCPKCLGFGINLSKIVKSIKDKTTKEPFHIREYTKLTVCNQREIKEIIKKSIAEMK